MKTIAAARGTLKTIAADDAATSVGDLESVVAPFGSDHEHIFQLAGALDAA